MMLPRRKNKVNLPPEECPLHLCMGVIGGRWAPAIIWYLSQGPRRFSELKDDIQGVSAKVLTTRLRTLQADGVINREVIPTSPPSVEYSLTKLGLELKPAIEAIVAVGHKLKERNNP